MSFTVLHVLITLLSIVTLIPAQTFTSADSGYAGYTLTLDEQNGAAVYDTYDTPYNGSVTNPPPDVFLNASVHVGEIDIEVDNLTAKVNLDAQVLSLLQFNAGVDLSIDKVKLLIQNVDAKVTLEARLANLVAMIDDVLNSIDLNPVIAQLGDSVSSLVGDVGQTVGSLTGDLTKRSSYELDNNILYSINNYEGNTHTNRVLAQNGDIVDQFLNNQGDIQSTQVVGRFSSDMTFTGVNETTTKNGQPVNELQFVYTPFAGLRSVAAIFLDAEENVIATQVISEVFAGGESTIGDELK